MFEDPVEIVGRIREKLKEEFKTEGDVVETAQHALKTDLSRQAEDKTREASLRANFPEEATVLKTRVTEYDAALKEAQEDEKVIPRVF